MIKTLSLYSSLIFYIMKIAIVPMHFFAFYNLFTRLEQRFPALTVVDDFLTVMINGFMPPEYEFADLATLAKYAPPDKETFRVMIVEFIRLYNDRIDSGMPWYDGFGDFYQVLRGRPQNAPPRIIFPPSEIVELVVAGTIDTGQRPVGKRVYDPACISGQFLIAFHARYPGNFVFGVERDPLCSKMACVNMMLHGCQGTILNLNEIGTRGWRINPDMATRRLPSIHPMSQSEVNAFMAESPRWNITGGAPADPRQ